MTETSDYRNMTLEVHTVPFEFLDAKWALTAAISKDEISAPVRAMRNQIILISLICLVVIAAVGTFLAQGITRPLTRIVENMNKLAKGDMDVETDARNRSDEIGDMLRSVTVFRDNALERSRLETEHSRLQHESEENRRAMMRDLAEEFSTNVGVIVEAVSSASSQLQTTATAMEEISEQTSSRATSVSAASEEASLNVQSVASSTEEMSKSIEEITRCVVEASAASRKAVDDVNLYPFADVRACQRFRQDRRCREHDFRNRRNRQICLHSMPPSSRRGPAKLAGVSRLWPAKSRHLPTRPLRRRVK